MAKLSAAQIDEYFAIHLPYRTRIMLAHYRMARSGKPFIQADWEAMFEASLITGRMYLNVMGIGRNSDRLAPHRTKGREIGAKDLGAHPVPVKNINPEDVALFLGFLRMADEGAAHLTTPRVHPVADTHIAITRICEYVTKYLYQTTGRTCADIEAHLNSLKPFAR